MLLMIAVPLIFWPDTQTFINAWNKLSQLRDLSKFRPWLCAIARNHVKSFIRTNKRDILQKAKRMESINDKAAEDSGPLESAINKEHAELVSTAIGHIPGKYREPCKALQGYPKDQGDRFSRPQLHAACLLKYY